MVFARQILIQQLDTFVGTFLKPPEAISSVKALFSRIEVGIDIIFVLTVPMCVTGVTLTVPIASGIKLFKKGQIVRPLV